MLGCGLPGAVYSAPGWLSNATGGNPVNPTSKPLFSGGYSPTADVADAEANAGAAIIGCAADDESFVDEPCDGAIIAAAEAAEVAEVTAGVGVGRSRPSPRSSSPSPLQGCAVVAGGNPPAPCGRIWLASPGCTAPPPNEERVACRAGSCRGGNGDGVGWGGGKTLSSNCRHTRRVAVPAGKFGGERPRGAP